MIAATRKTFVNGVYFCLNTYSRLIYRLDIRQYPEDNKQVVVAILVFYNGLKIEDYQRCNLIISERGIVFFSMVSSVLMHSDFIPFKNISLCEIPTEKVS